MNLFSQHFVLLWVIEQAMLFHVLHNWFDYDVLAHFAAEDLVGFKDSGSLDDNTGLEVIPVGLETGYATRSTSPVVASMYNVDSHTSVKHVPPQVTQNSNVLNKEVYSVISILEGPSGPSSQIKKW